MAAKPLCVLVLNSKPKSHNMIDIYFKMVFYFIKGLYSESYNRKMLFSF